jgi:hypothetical protein
MTEHLLLLYPLDPGYAPDAQDTLADVLRETGLIGEKIESKPEHYRTGNNFLQLITFLGCSPTVDLSGKKGGHACHIRLPEPTAHSRFLFGSNVKPPRCPACRVYQHQGIELGRAWERNHAQSSLCSSCGAETTVPLLDWRKAAAFGRTVIEVTGVYESEAVPGEELLAALEKASGVAWSYCYLRR